MAALSPTSPKSPAFENSQGIRPAFCIGQHDSARWTTLTDGFHNYILRSGVSNHVWRSTWELRTDYRY